MNLTLTGLSVTCLAAAITSSMNWFSLFVAFLACGSFITMKAYTFEPANALITFLTYLM